MQENKKVEFEIQVDISDATDKELDSSTRQLLSELKELNVESAELVKNGEAPDGSKGDAVTLGNIAVELLPTIIPGVVTLIQSWMARGQGRTVKFKGKGIEFEGSLEDLEKLLSTLDEGKTKE